MMDYLKAHCEQGKHYNLELMENTRKFCHQIIHEMLVDNEFAASTLNEIDPNAIKFRDERDLLGVMKNYWIKTNMVPSVEAIKDTILEKYSDEIDIKIASDLLDHCLKLELVGKRKEEIHLRWDVVYCMFRYADLLNDIYATVRDTESVLLDQFANMRRLAKNIEEWRKEFYNDKHVQKVLGGKNISDPNDNWDVV